MTVSFFDGGSTFDLPLLFRCRPVNSKFNEEKTAVPLIYGAAR